jgi:hypothetical protein
MLKVGIEAWPQNVPRAVQERNGPTRRRSANNRRGPAPFINNRRSCGEALKHEVARPKLPDERPCNRRELRRLGGQAEPSSRIAGIGEGGLLVAPAAITNATEDVSLPYGTRVTYQYPPPSKSSNWPRLSEAIRMARCSGPAA